MSVEKGLERRGTARLRAVLRSISSAKAESELCLLQETREKIDMRLAALMIGISRVARAML
ncbi:MAG: hypothetical protein DME76_12500 [Verrucomicrobia bacterium]|nr:MAG: hypothetical protein DME76_12500 [Verrucomicrobiota bacterium]